MTLFKFGVLNPFVPRECFVSNDIVQIGVLNPFLRVCISELAGYLHVACQRTRCMPKIRTLQGAFNKNLEFISHLSLI
jgi:hypothetical protein